MFVETVKGGLLLYDQRVKLASVWKRLRRWIKRGNEKILVVGPGGAGKSTLGKILANGPGVYEAPSAYRESITTEKLDLPGDIAATLLVAPGQALRRRRTWPALLRDLTTGRSCGIINVVAYGYHSFEGELSYKELPAFEKGMTAKQFTARYIMEKQRAELDVLRELQAYLVSAPGRIWFLTVVTKQDLWWDDRRAVQRHYESGEYGGVIDEIEKLRGSHGFVHEYISASLVMQNLLSGRGEILADTTGGYDEVIQSANLQAVFETVHRLLADA